MIRDLLEQIDQYSARNQRKKEEKAEAERRRLHEAQHAGISKGNPEEAGSFTAGGNQRNTVSPQPSVEDEEEEKEIDPSIVGTLDDVYTEESEMKSEDDPFKKVPVMDEHNKPASLHQLEKSMDAVVEYSEQGTNDSIQGLGSEDELSSLLDQGGQGLPDILGTRDNTSPPDVTSGDGRPDLAETAPVDLLEAGDMSTQPVDLTDGLGQS